MSLLRCTKRLQKEMGLKANDFMQDEPTTAYLGTWHVNLLHINRRKFVLFTNDRTLFNFIVADLTRPQIKELGTLFTFHLSCVLSEEGIPPDVHNRILAEYRNLAYANTNSKSVLGSMNDLAFNYKYSILEAGGVQSPLVPNIIQKINRIPLSAIEYSMPIERLRNLYGIED